MKLLAGNSNRPLAEAIAAFLGQPLTHATVQRFADMEVFVEIHENVRGEDVFVNVAGGMRLDEPAVGLEPKPRSAPHLMRSSRWEPTWRRRRSARSRATTWSW